MRNVDKLVQSYHVNLNHQLTDRNCRLPKKNLEEKFKLWAIVVKMSLGDICGWATFVGAITHPQMSPTDTTFNKRDLSPLIIIQLETCFKQVFSNNMV